MIYVLTSALRTGSQRASHVMANLLKIVPSWVGLDTPTKQPSLPEGAIHKTHHLYPNDFDYFAALQPPMMLVQVRRSFLDTYVSNVLYTARTRTIQGLNSLQHFDITALKQTDEDLIAYVVRYHPEFTDLVCEEYVRHYHNKVQPQTPHFVFQYEHFEQDPLQVTISLARFLQLTPSTADILNAIGSGDFKKGQRSQRLRDFKNDAHISIGNQRRNVVHGWKDYLSEEDRATVLLSLSRYVDPLLVDL
jgi:hypothetical protein